MKGHLNPPIICVAASLIFVICAAFDLPFLDTNSSSCDDYCMQGSCVSSSLLPKCKCNNSWRNILNQTFLPCAVPNCTFDLSCDHTASSPPSSSPSPSTGFNPCSYGVCGKGDCISSLKNDSIIPFYSYTCKCHEGYQNLLNSSSGICVSDCNIGTDCKGLDISSGGSESNSSSNVTPSSSSSNGGISSSIKSTTKLALTLLSLFTYICL